MTVIMKTEKIIDPSLLPREAITGEPLAPRRTPGYYPGFSTLSQSLFLG